MGKIMYNGEVYSGLTVSSSSTSNKSENITYDNKNSGLVATNVQNAIDELSMRPGGTGGQGVIVQFVTWEAND